MAKALVEGSKTVARLVAMVPLDMRVRGLEVYLIEEPPWVVPVIGSESFCGLAVEQMSILHTVSPTQAYEQRGLAWAVSVS